MIPFTFGKLNEKSGLNCSAVSIYSQLCIEKKNEDNKFVYILASEVNETWDPPFEWLGKFRVPNYVRRAVKEKRAAIIIDITLECLQDYVFKKMFNKWQTLNGFSDDDKDYIFYLTSNNNIDANKFPGCTIISDHFVIGCAKNIWFSGKHSQMEKEMLSSTIDKIQTIRSQQQWKYKFVCLQQRPREFRKKLYKKLRKKYTTDESLCTLRADNDLDFIEKSPYDDTNSSEDLLPNGYFRWTNIQHEHFSKAKYALVSERNYLANEEAGPFTTEKVIKNLMLPQPFVLCSFKGHVQELKNLGFKVYEDLIDHSYDTASDNERMDLLIKELDRVLDLNITDYIDHAAHNREIIKNNRSYENVIETISKTLEIRE